MPPLDRRHFLAGAAGAGAAVLARPATAAPQKFDTDIVVIGAGAAGIAAARRILAADRRCVVLEASGRIGGRCVTDTKTFGVPFDRGAHWLWTPDFNPVAKLAPATGRDLYAAPPGQRVRIGRRWARESEREDFLVTWVKARRAIREAAERRTDVATASALSDLGGWGDTVEFLQGPLTCGADLANVSARDLARATEHTRAALCRQGLGSLVAALAADLPVRLDSPVTRINTWVRGGVEIDAPGGTIRARGVIVTVSTAVLAAGKIDFVPDLPRGHADALAKLSLGSLDHVALEMPGNPLGLQSDDLVFEKAESGESAAMLANVSGSALSLVRIAGPVGAALARKGEREMVAYALDWLERLFGSGVREAVRRTAASRWSEEPFVRGAVSVAAVGGHEARTALAAPVRDRVWFAGEATHETAWGTVGGAWQSGERAADEALKRLRLGPAADADPPPRPVRRRPPPPPPEPRSLWPF
ncbi:putative Flavin containing amine oxidoreductase [Rhodovulum sp. PH10]|uniref:flavin monoamine oxidase family protein n=1 Tax=Rhodovulum sp. PH10 TaxID=1187851 RepID=UPI00027C1F9D|nr:NAD(P)/FAD-dependent oxidoreductase [Rhodovulum sp. PH10]EJW13259.1 putative Flavin containing amine oxidoreductase [Rhodovulum sp. PH10]